MKTWFRTNATYAPGWFWTPWTKRFAHGGWVYCTWRHPLNSLRWLWLFRRGNPSRPEVSHA